MENPESTMPDHKHSHPGRNRRSEPKQPAATPASQPDPGAATPSVHHGSHTSHGTHDHAAHEQHDQDLSPAAPLSSEVGAVYTCPMHPEVVQDTAGILFKQREDVAALTQELIGEALAPETT